MEECLKNQKQVPPKFMKPKESGPGTRLDIAQQLPTTFESLYFAMPGKTINGVIV